MNSKSFAPVWIDKVVMWLSRERWQCSPYIELNLIQANFADDTFRPPFGVVYGHTLKVK